MDSNFILKKIKESLKKEILILSEDSIQAENLFQFVTIPKPAAVVFPDNIESLSCILKICHDEEISIIIKGAGTNIWDMDFNCQKCILIDTTKLTGFYFHKGDSIVEAFSGTVFYNIQKSLIRENSYIPFIPFFSQNSTIGGIYSYSPVLLLSGLYGGIEDLVTGVDFITSDGNIYSFGSKCIKDVTGYDLPAFMVNTTGNLAIVTKIFIKVFPYKYVKQLYKISGDFVSLLSLISDFDERNSVRNYKLFIPDGENSVLYLELDDNPLVVSEATSWLDIETGKFEIEKVKPDLIIPFAFEGQKLFGNILKNFSAGTIVELFINGYFPAKLINHINNEFEVSFVKYFVTGNFGRYYFYYFFNEKFSIGSYREFLDVVSGYYGKITRIKSSDKNIKENFQNSKIFRWSRKIKNTFDEKMLLSQ